MNRTFTAGSSMLLAAAVAACSSDTVVPPPLVPAHLEIVAGDQQSGSQGRKRRHPALRWHFLVGDDYWHHQEPARDMGFWQLGFRGGSRRHHPPLRRDVVERADIQRADIAERCLGHVVLECVRSRRTVLATSSFQEFV